MIRRWRWLMALVLLWIPACGEAGAPTPAEPGIMGLQIVESPAVDTGAFTVTLTARSGHAMTLGATQPTYRVFSRAVSEREIRLLIVGPLRTGAILAVEVTDLNDSTAYAVQLGEVTEASGTLRPTAPYRLALVPLRR